MSNTNLRLQDPDNLLTSKELEEYNEKISVVLGRMARSTEKYGNPFFYSLAATKHHVVKKDIGVTGWETAATDGIVYFWHPNFLKELDILKLTFVQIHESMHVICRHVDRFEGKKVNLWRLAIDFYVNAAIEKDYKDKGRFNSLKIKEGEHPIFNGPLGTPITVAEVKTRMKEFHDNPEKVLSEQELKEKRCCFDPSVIGKSADDIYNELLEQYKKYPPPPKMGICFGDGDGSGDSENWDFLKDLVGDEHIKLKISKKDVLKQLLQAAETARRMRGTIPSEIMEELKHLEEPQLTWQDLCRQSIQRVKEHNGKLNDWTRFRKRGLALGLYMPTKIQYNGKILAMVDTSGSMSNDDMVYAISQLRVIESHTTAVIVPNDAAPHWEHAITVKNSSDLSKFKAVGRGGTDFTEFFRDYKKKLGHLGPFDLIVILTDGQFGTIPLEFRPPCDTVWVITNNYKPEIPFGFLAPLRNQRPEE